MGCGLPLPWIIIYSCHKYKIIQYASTRWENNAVCKWMRERQQADSRSPSKLKRNKKFKPKINIDFPLKSLNNWMRFYVILASSVRVHIESICRYTSAMIEIDHIHRLLFAGLTLNFSKMFISFIFFRRVSCRVGNTNGNCQSTDPDHQARKN